MSWRRKQKNRTEHGPTWEGPNAGQGCNSTHVARARRWWQNFARRTERRTGQTATSKFKMGSKRVRPPIDEDE
jgi:hypothetical protein